jgi:sec-independent protein translocase protein TatA
MVPVILTPLGNIFTPGDMIIILVVALLVFGRRLPEVARSLGRSINEFKKGMADVTDDVMRPPVDPVARQVPQPPQQVAGTYPTSLPAPQPTASAAPPAVSTPTASASEAPKPA